MGTRHLYAFTLAACIITGAKAMAQKGIDPTKLKQFNITVNADNQITKTQMLSASQNIKANNDRVYMWYASQKIIETKGGYDGKLIHGNYKSFYLNNQLKEQGQINYGLKHSEWKYWYPDGKLKEVINWENGVKQGTYLVYNDQGQLMAKGHFKNDKLHGTFYTYSGTGNVLEKKKYKQGNELPPHIKPPRVEKPKRVKEKTVKEKPVKQKRIKEPKKKPKAEEAPAEPATKGIPLFTRLFKKKARPVQPKEPPIAKHRVINS